MLSAFTTYEPSTASDEAVGPYISQPGMRVAAAPWKRPEGDPAETPQISAPRRTSLDQAKFRTRLCRHFATGQRCPFEDRCVFAHGEEQIVPPMRAASLASGADSLGEDDETTESPCSSQPNTFAPPAFSAPPSYDEFLSQAAISMAAVTNEGMEEGSHAPVTPVAADSSAASYGMRFRYEPYSTEGIRFE